MKLIFHIGAGKTGSSSVQTTLLKSKALLEKNGILYVGLMFEMSTPKLYDWQQAKKIEDFHALPTGQATQQVRDVLDHLIKEATSKGIHTIIWSNESFFGRMRSVMSALKIFEDRGHEIELIAYIRKHDSWIRSAYVQWGIKHKTYQGRIQTFSEWSERRTPVFYPGIQEVMSVFPNSFILRNMNAISDVVSDFLEMTGLDKFGIEGIRDNDSPSQEELFLRLLFNDAIEGQVLPEKFDNLVYKKNFEKETAEEILYQYLPNEKDIEKINELIATDRGLINKVFELSGQKLFSTTTTSNKEIKIDYNKLVTLLSQIVIKQSIKINYLSSIINKGLG